MHETCVSWSTDRLFYAYSARQTTLEDFLELPVARDVAQTEVAKSLHEGDIAVFLKAWCQSSWIDKLEFDIKYFKDLEEHVLTNKTLFLLVDLWKGSS